MLAGVRGAALEAARVCRVPGHNHQTVAGMPAVGTVGAVRAAVVWGKHQVPAAGADHRVAAGAPEATGCTASVAAESLVGS